MGAEEQAALPGAGVGGGGGRSRPLEGEQRGRLQADRRKDGVQGGEVSLGGSVEQDPSRLEYSGNVKRWV